MQKRDGFQMDFAAVGAGCLTLIGMGVVSILILMVMLSSMGISVADLRSKPVPSSLSWVILILRAGMYALVGYVTASRARHSRMAHALIMGGGMMLLGALLRGLSSLGAGLDFWEVIVWLMTIPLTLYGAGQAISADKGKADNGSL